VTRLRILAAAFVLALLLGSTDSALSQMLQQGTVEIAGPVTVPFKLSGNHIFVRASMNGKPFALVFDTGGAASLSPEAAQSLALPVVSKQPVPGAGDSVATLDIVEVKELRIGEVAYRGGQFLVLPAGLGLASPFADVAFGGVVGREFFGQVVTIDYQHSSLTFVPHESFKAAADDVKIPMTMRGGHLPNVTASIDGHSGSFDVDAGAGGALSVTDSFARASSLTSSWSRSVDMEYGRGIGGTIRGTVGRAQDMTLGSLRLADPVVAVIHAKGGVFSDPDLAGNIGGEILRRFTVTLDVPDNTLYLRPNDAFGAPFPFNRAGLTTTRDANRVTVREVIAGSPAARSGIVAGDVLAQIDGKAAGSLTTDQIRESWLQPAGTNVVLVLERGGNARTIRLVLRDLI
jgi:PDZ domain/Aspartyl protease